MREIFYNKASDEEIIEVFNKLDDVDIKNDCKWTPLHFACHHGRFKIVQHLIELGADINARSIDGCTPLYYACCKNNLEIVKFLIECGGDVNVKDNSGGTPLREACYRGRSEIVKLLIENGAAVQNELEDCFKIKYIKGIKLLTKAGACFL